MRTLVGKNFLPGLTLLLALLLTACNDSAAPTPVRNTPGSSVAVNVKTQPEAQAPKNSSTATPSANPRLGYASGPVAIVDGVEINAAEFNHALDTARVSYEEEEGNPVDWSTPDNQKTLQSMREDVLEGLINYQVVAEQAQKENITATPDEIQARLDDFKQQLGGPDAYQSWISRRFLADEDQRKAITQLIIFEKMEDRHSQVEDKAEQVHLRHIQLQTEAEAKQIYDKLRAGADFAALARQFSLDITTASRGGDLDFIFPGQTAQYGPDFERVAFSLKTNEISGPVKTPIGYHILQSLGKEVRPLPFDLVQQRKEEAFEGYIKTLRDKAKIEKKL